MTTSSGHTSAILASKVKGTAVYNEGGEKIGTVEDIVLDKQSNQILFAALGFGGVLGLGEKYYPVPWSLLDYDEDKENYHVMERRYGSFQRSLRLPDTVDDTKIDARFDNGVLKVTLPKRPELTREQRKIEIKKS